MKHTHNQRSKFTPELRTRCLLTKPHDMVSTEDEVINGRIFKRSKVKSYDTKSMLNMYKASDFYLENLIAAGIADTLQEGQASLNTLLNADAMEDVMYDMSNSLNNTDNG